MDLLIPTFGDDQSKLPMIVALEGYENVTSDKTPKRLLPIIGLLREAKLEDIHWCRSGDWLKACQFTNARETAICTNCQDRMDLAIPILTSVTYTSNEVIKT